VGQGTMLQRHLLQVKTFIFMAGSTHKYYVTEYEIRKAYGDMTA
jgi:hypothetical protein